MLYDLSLILPGITCFVWSVVMLCRFKANNRAQNIWIAAGLTMCVSTGVWAVFFGGIHDYALFYKLELLEAFTTLLLPPLLFFCFRALTGEQRFGWREYVWLLPALLIGGSMMTLYEVMGEENAVGYIREVSSNQGRLVTYTAPIYQTLNFMSVVLYKVLVIVQIIHLLAYATVRLIRYRHRLSNFFSNREGKSLENATTVLVLLYVVLVLSLITYRGRFYYNEPSLFVSLHMFAWAVVINIMGYNVYKMRYSADEFAHEIALADSQAAVPAIADGEAEPESAEWSEEELENKYADLVEKFHHVIDVDKIYLQKKLRVIDVANAIYTNRTYVSRIINHRYKSTFSDFINAKRVEYAQQLMRTEPGISQEEIADRSGFLHVTTFSRIFKERVGMTYREWQRKNPPGRGERG